MQYYYDKNINICQFTKISNFRIYLTTVRFKLETGNDCTVSLLQHIDVKRN